MARGKEQVVTRVTGWRLPQQTLLPLIKWEAGRLCFNQLIASLGIQQPAQVLSKARLLHFQAPASRGFQVGGRGSGSTGGEPAVCVPHFPCRGNEPQIEGEEKKGSAENVPRETKLSYDPGLPLLRPGALSNQAGFGSKLKSVKSL